MSVGASADADAQRANAQEEGGPVGQGMYSLEVLGGELVAEEAGRGAHGLLDDPGALRDTGDKLEGAVPPLRCLLAVAARQEPARNSKRRSAQCSPRMSLD